MEDEILREIRATRDAFAAMHNFDVHAMVADLRARDSAGDWIVVNRPPRRPALVAIANPSPVSDAISAKKA